MSEVEQAPVIGISYKIPMPVQKELVFQIWVERDMSIEHLNDILDKVRLAGEHQCRFARKEAEFAKAGAKIEEEEKHVEFLEDQIGQLKSSAASELEKFEAESANSNGKARMRDASRAVLDQARDKWKRYEEDVAVRRQRIADTRKALEAWL